MKKEGVKGEIVSYITTVLSLLSIFTILFLSAAKEIMWMQNITTMMIIVYLMAFAIFTFKNISR